MAQIRNQDDGHVYRAEVEQIDLASYGPQPDPAWRYTDAAGHEHDAKHALLVRVQDDPDEPPFYFDGEGEEYNAPSHLECSLCGEHIAPAYVAASPFRRTVPGMTRYYRDEVEITEVEFREAISR